MIHRLAIWSAAVLLLAGVPDAFAGAWNESAGDGLMIVRGSAEGGAQSFTADGRRVIATPAYRKLEADTYVEYGLTDRFQLIVDPDLVSTSVAGSPGGSYAGFGTSAAGAQVQLLERDRWAFAVQGMVQWPATTRQTNLALIGNTSRNIDARLLAGRSFDFGPWPSFVDVETAYRFRSDGASDEVHLDVTVGTHLSPKLMVMLQDFVTLPTGCGTPWFPHSQYSNLEGSVVYEFAPFWSLQLGAVRTIQGHDALRETSGIIALWRRF